MEHGALCRYELPAAGSLRIGREESSDVILHGAAASRCHAVLHVGANLALEDLGSRNGTLIRDRRIAAGERVPIRRGDPIRIGSTILVVQNAPRPSVAARPASSGEHDIRLSASTIIRDAAMQNVYRMLAQVAPSTIGILVLGETGVGKELIAESVHRLSGPRSRGPFVRINCAALTESIFESEVFGHQQGSFTGAVRAKPGLLELADKGTVFLDEVGELQPSVQAKLLRAIESREITRVGAVKPLSIDVRFVAATNRDLRADVQAGTFREDLFFRLNGVCLRVPPLRERPSEIEDLVHVFLTSMTRELGRPPPPALSQEVMRLLREYAWPGNIRELKNAIECATLLSNGGPIEAMHLPAEVTTLPEANARSPELGPISRPRAEEAGDARPPDSNRQDMEERERIVAALQACHGNQTRAAAYLKMPRRTLVSKLTAYEIPRPRKPSPPEG